ncbi:MAG: GAF domain-containing protein [Candidatus Schekmanbacteria bacterium]|nr:GAF domain-containing protein [Candidatus Schekmanbacteria bacterium]
MRKKPHTKKIVHTQQDKINHYLKKLNSSKSKESILQNTLLYSIALTGSDAGVATILKENCVELAGIYNNGKWESNLQAKYIESLNDYFTNPNKKIKSLRHIPRELQFKEQYPYLANNLIINLNNKKIGAIILFRKHAPYEENELKEIRLFLTHTGMMLESALNKETKNRYSTNLKAINNIIKYITSERSMTQIIKRIAPVMKQIVRFDSMVITVFDEEEDIVTDLYHYSTERYWESKNINAPISSPKIKYILKTKKFHISADIRTDPKLPARQTAVDSGMVSELIVGCLSKGKVLGALSLMKKESDYYTKADGEYAEMLSRQLGNAIERFRYNNIISRKNRYSGATNFITRETLCSKNTTHAIKYLFKEMSECVPFDAAMIGFFSDDFRKVRIQIYVSGKLRKGIEYDVNPDNKESLVYHLKNRRRFLTVDQAEKASFMEEKIAVMSGLQSSVIAPLSMPDKVIGFLALASRKKKAFDQTDLSGTGMIAGNFTMALQNNILTKDAIQEKLNWEKTFDSISDYILLTNSDGKIIHLNKSAQGLIRKTGKLTNVQDIQTFFAKLGIIVDESYKTVTFDESKTVNFTVQAKDKSRFYEISINPCCIYKVEKPETAVFLIKDITHHKNTESESKRLYKVASKQAFQLKTLNIIAKISNSSVPSNKVFFDIGREIEKVIPFDSIGRIWVYDKEKNPISIYFLRQQHIRFPVEQALKAGIGQTAISETIRTAKPLIRNIKDGFNTFTEDKQCLRYGVNSIMYIPLKSRKSISGCITLGRKNNDCFTDDDIPFLEQVAVHISSMIERNVLLKNILIANKEWETTFNSISDYIFITDLDYNITKYNETFRKTFIEPMVHRSSVPIKCYDLFNCTNYKKDGKCITHKLMAGAKPTIIEYEDKERGRILLISVSPISMPETGTEGCVHIATDITDIRNAERKLNKQTSQLDTLLNDFPDSIVMFDSDKKVIKSNKLAQKVHGFINDTSFDDFLNDFLKNIKMTDLSGKEVPYDSLPLVKAFKYGEPTINNLYNLEFKGGKRICGIINVSLIKDRKGNVQNIISTFKDITEQREKDDKLIKQAEELNNIFTTFHDGLLIIDIKEKKIIGNNEVKKIFANPEETDFKFDPESFFLRNRYFDTNGIEIEPKDRPIAKTLSEGIPIVNKEVTLLVDNKKKSSLLVNTAPLLDKNGEIYGILGVFKDITAQKKLEIQLINSEKLSSLGTMVSGIAHELNNPLSGILGFSELLLGEKFLHDKIKNKIKTIHTQAERAAKIVEGLLSFSKQKAAEKSLLDINRTVEDTLELINYGLKESKVIVRKHLGNNLPLIYGDKNQIIQVIINVINNSVQSLLKKGGEGFIKISSSLELHHDSNSDKKKKEIRIDIEDSGIGIEKNHLIQIFDPFFTTSPTGEGTGLGLSISYGIIKEHGGEITAESTVGKGTTVSIFIPASDMESSELILTQKVSITPFHKLKKLTRILVIVSETAFGHGIADSLNNNMRIIMKAKNANDALEKIKSVDFDIVISGLKLPDMDSISFYKEATKIKNYLADRFLFVTEQATDWKTNKFLRMTGNKYITKPFKESDIQKAVSTFFSN